MTTIDPGHFTSLFGSSKFRTYHIDVAATCGGIHAAIFLEYIISWSESKSEEWIFRTMPQITDDTGLTRAEQETARKRLRNCGVLSEQIMGLPGKLHFKVNHVRFVESMQATTSQTSLLESRKQACGNPATSLAGIQQTIKGDSKENSRVREQSNSTHPSLSRKSLGYTDEFELFWASYPVGNSGKGSKAEAFREWKRITDHTAVFTSLIRWKDCEQWHEGFIKHAHRWLKDGLWEQDPPVSKPKTFRKAIGPDFVAKARELARREQGGDQDDYQDVVETTGVVL